MLLFLSFCLSVDKPVLVVLPFLLRDLLFSFLMGGLEDDEDDEEEEEEETEEVEESADEVAPINPSLLLCFTSTFATDTSQLPLLLLLLP